MKIFGSKKATVTIITAVVDLIAIVLTMFVLEVDPETKAKIITALVALAGVIIGTYNIGQGIADHGQKAKVLLLLLIPLALIGAGCATNQAFLAECEKYHDYSSKIIEQYIIKGDPVPTFTVEEKADLQQPIDKFEKTIKAEKDK